MYSYMCIRRSQWPRGLRSGSRPFAGWDCGFEFCRGHGCLSLMSVVYCQVEVFASGWSLLQRSPTERVVSESDREASIPRRPWPTRGCCAIGKKENIFRVLALCVTKGCTGHKMTATALYHFTIPTYGAPVSFPFCKLAVLPCFYCWLQEIKTYGVAVFFNCIAYTNNLVKSTDCLRSSNVLIVSHSLIITHSLHYIFTSKTSFLSDDGKHDEYGLDTRQALKKGVSFQVLAHRSTKFKFLIAMMLMIPVLWNVMDAVSFDDWTPTFRNIVSPSAWREINRATKERSAAWWSLLII
jgi:hypothetical protein